MYLKQIVKQNKTIQEITYLPQSEYLSPYLSRFSLPFPQWISFADISITTHVHKILKYNVFIIFECTYYRLWYIQ